MNKKHITHTLGFFLVAVSFLFIGQRLWLQLHDLPSLHLTGDRLLLLISGSIFYGISRFFLAGAWHFLIVFFAGRPIARPISIWIYARTHIARYIPGNVLLS